MNGPGDVDAGKAWRAVRRPSDMVLVFFHHFYFNIDLHNQNEYSKQIREFRSQEKPGKAYGKVFVKGDYSDCV